jgi:hypothetical protein
LVAAMTSTPAGGGGGAQPNGGAKAQHYVPQFILRNFSPDGTHISMVLLPEGRRVPAAKIARQCQERFFYGEDQVMEKSFAREESRISALLGDLSVGRLGEMSGDDDGDLIRFAHYQHARTLGAAEGLNAMADDTAKAVLRETIRLIKGAMDITEEDLDLVDLRLTAAQHESLWIAATSGVLLTDMALKFIVTSRTPGFVLSDHPVVLNNQYIEHHPDLQHLLSINGLTAKGLQMFMPLSPSVALAIFDPAVYEYGGASKVCKAGPADVAFLNQMQRFKSPKGGKVTMGDLHDRPDGTKDQFMIVEGPNADIRIGAKLSFVRSKNNHGYYGYPYAFAPVRSEERVVLAERLRQLLDAQVDATRAAKGLPPYYGGSAYADSAFDEGE